jgi:hypothetical protein
MAQNSDFIRDYRNAWLNHSLRQAHRGSSRGEHLYWTFSDTSAVNADPTETPVSQPPEELLFRHAEVIVEKYGVKLLQDFPVATAVAVSLKYSNGEIVPNQPSVSFFVDKKLPVNKLGNRAIPKEIDGVPTDVVEAGIPRVLSSAGVPHIPGTRARPAPPGSSVAHLRVTSGTFGCLVEDRTNTYILSCAHVLSDAAGVPGDHILQPGAHFGGTTPHDHIASLSRTIPLFSGTCIADAAIAQVHDPLDVIPDVLGIGRPTGTLILSRVGRSVQKSGDQTGLTSGTVVGIKGTVGPLSINGAANVYFSDVILTTGMSDSGDSGALLMDNGSKAIGLLFGGLVIGSTYAISWYNPIDNILQNLGVTLVT